MSFLSQVNLPRVLLSSRNDRAVATQDYSVLTRLGYKLVVKRAREV